MISTTNPDQTPDSFKEKIPGEQKSLKTKVIEKGANLIQSFDPIKSINMHLCGFAFYCNDRSRQVGLHHYGHFLNEDFGQFIVYDSQGPDARMIGIEYVVTERVFSTLSSEEQKYWHNHSYDVESGSFFAPSIPDAVEKGIMLDVAATYGKTFLLWQVDRGDPLPLGPPQLMMVANKNGQWKETLYEQRAKEMKCSVNDFFERRKEMTFPPIHPGADAWSRGEGIDLKVVPLEDDKPTTSEP